VKQAISREPLLHCAATPDVEVYFHDDEEIDFLLWEVLDIERTLLDKPPFNTLTRARIEELFAQAKSHAARLAAAYSDADGDDARLLDNGEVAIPQKYTDLWKEHLRDWFWLRNHSDTVTLSVVQREHLPHVVLQLVSEMFGGANPAFMTYAGFTPSAVNLLKARGTERQQEVFLDKLKNTEWDACLCVTEPQAGSDLSAIATTASQIDGDIYSVSGEKRYITAGMHPLTKNTLYIVLGRISGVKASSLSMSAFLVPRYWQESDGSLSNNNVRCVRVENKMGLRGCANTHLRFGTDGITRGYLLGNRPNVGLLQMQMLMRKARIGTGQLALAMASSAYLRSLRYARGRIQGPSFEQSSNPAAPRIPIIQHLDVQRMLLEMRAKVEGCRALVMKISLNGSKLQQALFQQRSREEPDLKRYAGLALMYSPIAKAYVSDEAWNIATAAIQVHGAVGYMRDLPLEQYARDIKILTIWEGTNYIQAQDLVRDKLGFGRQSLVLQHLEEEVRVFLRGLGERSLLAPEYDRLALALDAVLATMRWVKEQSDAGALLPISQFCTRILQMFGDLIAAWGLLEAAAVAERRLSEVGGADSRRAFYLGKIKTMQFFYYNLLPRLFSNREIIADSGRACVRLDDAEFGFTGAATD
jgi:acyl-CoA dehydrogenase